MVRRKNRMEEQGSLPLIHRKFHLPLWTGITLPGPFLFACDVINAFASKVSALIVWSGHLSVVVISIRFVPFSVVPWPSRGKFLHSLAKILSMAYHTSPLNRYHSLRLSSFGSVGKFYFFSLPCLWNAWYRGFIVFSMATTKCTLRFNLKTPRVNLVTTLSFQF